MLWVELFSPAGPAGYSVLLEIRYFTSFSNFGSCSTGGGELGDSLGLRRFGCSAGVARPRETSFKPSGALSAITVFSLYSGRDYALAE